MVDFIAGGDEKSNRTAWYGMFEVHHAWAVVVETGWEGRLHKSSNSEAVMENAVVKFCRVGGNNNYMQFGSVREM